MEPKFIEDKQIDDDLTSSELFERELFEVYSHELIGTPKGFHYVPNFLTRKECEYLTTALSAQEWRTDLKRRTQHYGIRYDYSSRSLKFDVPSIESSVLAPLVKFLNPFFQDFINKSSASRKFPISQIIVNEYLPGEKISPHIDAPCFGPVVMTITLGTAAYFVMTQNGVRFEIKPAEGDLIILSDEARYKWKHETLPFKKEGRRISITFRSIICQ